MNSVQTDVTPALTPSLFVPHGAPTFALRPGAAGAALTMLGRHIQRPRAIVMVSAHWDTAVPTVGFAEKPETIHDFFGFPDALYQLRYPATGCPEAAHEVVAAIQQAGFSVAQDAQRGLDHGAWVPLRLMFPEADIPVIPVSIQSGGGVKQAYALGTALAPLRSQGFLVIGSGSLTHNLRDYQLASLRNGETPGYVRAFSDWIEKTTEQGDTEALLNYRQLAPEAQRAHPTDEHLLPFFVSLGAGLSGPVKKIHSGIDDFVIAMDAYAFG